MLKLFEILSNSQKRKLIIIIFLILFAACLEVAGIGIIVPILMIIVNDNLNDIVYLSSIIEYLEYPSKFVLITYAMSGLILISLFKLIFMTMYNYFHSKYVWSVLAELSERIFNIYIYKPYSFHLESNSSKLISDITNEVNQVVNGVLGNTILLMTDVILAGAIIIFLISLQPSGILIAASFIIVFIYIFLLLTKKYIKKWGGSRQIFDQLRMKDLHQGFHGIKDVKIYNKEDYFSSAYATKTIKYSQMRTLENFIQKAPSSFIEFSGVLGVSLLVIFLLMTGNSPSELIVTVGVFAAAAFRITPSLNRIAATISGIRFSLPALHRLHGILNTGKELKNRNKKFNSNKINNLRELRIERMSFGYYSSKTRVLRDIDIEIKNKESIGIVGASGAGKSTLVDIILGLIVPSSGKILINNNNLQEYKLDWQSKIGYVPQDIYMIDDTIMRNVAFGVEENNIDEDKVWQAVKLSQLEDFILKLPNKLNTLIGERGTRVSGGQRQRIGIARALYNNPEIVIFDEATSSLDQKTEEDLMTAVNSLFGKKTIIIVSHRLSTVSECNYIYHLKNGKIDAKYSNEEFKNKFKK